MGGRLGKYMANNMKCMRSINGRTVIERAFRCGGAQVRHGGVLFP
jgi:hypothetical protein